MAPSKVSDISWQIAPPLWKKCFIARHQPKRLTGFIQQMKKARLQDGRWHSYVALFFCAG